MHVCMYFAEPSTGNMIYTPNNGDDLGSFVGAAVGIVITLLFVILIGCAVLRYKTNKKGLAATSSHATDSVAIPMVGGLTALLIYFHRLAD